MAIVTIKFGSAGTGRDVATLAAAWAAVPADVVASGNSYILEAYNDSEFVVGSNLVLTGKTTDAAHTILIRPAAGHSFRDHANVATNALVYNQANGVGMRFNFNYTEGLTINNDWVTVQGMQFWHSGGGNVTGVLIGTGRTGSVIDNCLVRMTSSNTGVAGISLNSGTVRSTHITLLGATSTGVYMGSSTSKAENVTVARVSTQARAGYGFNAPGLTGGSIINCAVFNAPFGVNNSFTGSNNASDGVVGFGTNNKENLVFADQFVDTTNDFRTKAGSALIDAGTAPNAANTLAPTGVRQQGTAADIGFWEFPSATQAPTATITAINVSGRTVTISGTTTGTPTSGLASIAPAAGAGNNAVAQGPTALTLGTGTFTVQFTNVVVGRYSPALTVSNTAFPNVAASNSVGTFDIVGALATSVIQDPMNGGQVLTIHGTTSGSPTSGSLSVPAAATNPNGAVAQTVALTLGAGTYTVSVTLSAGNYDAPVLTFTTAAGTSLPQAGTSPVSVMGFSGNPEAPPANPPAAATVTGVTVTPGTSTGTQQFAATVQGTNSPSQAVTWTKTGGGTISSSGLFTAPAATGSVQTITITATSDADPTKSGTATVTIAATAPTPTVTAVTVAPSTANVAGGATQQFDATVTGTNSPSQAVTWAATAGTVSSSGLFTAPAATSAIQTVTVTATSVANTARSGTAIITVPALPPVDPDPVDPPYEGEAPYIVYLTTALL